MADFYLKYLSIGLKIKVLEKALAREGEKSILYVEIVLVFGVGRRNFNLLKNRKTYEEKAFISPERNLFVGGGNAASGD